MKTRLFARGIGATPPPEEEKRETGGSGTGTVNTLLAP
jgi:hypothetical protein